MARYRRRPSAVRSSLQDSRYLTLGAALGATTKRAIRRLGEYNQISIAMAAPSTSTSQASAECEGLSPSPNPGGIIDPWEDDDDDIEYQPASEQSEDTSRTGDEEDAGSEYMGEHDRQQ